MTSIACSPSVLPERDLARNDFLFPQTPMKKHVAALFMTYNPFATSRLELPNDTRSLFRVVTLIKPDYNILLKAKCAASGIKAPAILGTRLKMVRDLASDLL